MASKRWFFNFIYLLFIFYFLLSLISYIFDPLQLFHKPFIQDEGFIEKDMRKQAAGIINNYDFDSIIIGTSMLANTSSFEASSKLNSNFINISMNGSDYYERDFILSYALKNKNIKNVIYSLDYFYLYQTKSNVSDYYFLYDDIFINDFNIYFSDKFFQYIKNSFLNEKKYYSLEYPNEWFSDTNNSVRFGGLENWFKANNNNEIRNVFNSYILISNKIKNNEKISLIDIDEKIKLAKEYIDKYLLLNIKEYENTKFILVFPPYTRYEYSGWKQYNQPNYEIHKAIIRYLVDKSIIYKNLEIYGYEDNDFLDEIKYYKDFYHYDKSINSLMLDSFKNKTNIININNVDNYISDSEYRALNYNVFEIANQLENYLNENK